MPTLEEETLALLAEVEQALGAILAGTPPDDYRACNRVVYSWKTLERSKYP